MYKLSISQRLLIIAALEQYKKIAMSADNADDIMKTELTLAVGLPGAERLIKEIRE